MAYFALAFAVLLGYVLGHLLTFGVLVFLTIVSVVVCAVSFRVLKEMAVLGAMLLTVLAIVLNLAMWTTYYLETHQHAVGDFFRGYILR